MHYNRLLADFAQKLGVDRSLLRLEIESYAARPAHTRGARGAHGRVTARGRATEAGRACPCAVGTRAVLS